MFGTQLRAAIEAAPRAKLCELAGAIWKGFAAGALGEVEAGELAALVEAKKVAAVPEKVTARRRGSAPRSAASLERRRRWTAAGMSPPSISCRFTMGEQAVLAVIALEVQKRGRCELTVGAIGATAGVCPTTVRNALREAQRLGLLTVEERRVGWNRNLPNLLRIVSPEWATWLRLGRKGGGYKFAKCTPTRKLGKAFAPFQNPSNGMRRHGRHVVPPDSNEAKISIMRPVEERLTNRGEIYPS